MKYYTLIKTRFQKTAFLASLLLLNISAFAQPANDCIFNAIDITPVINGISQSNAFDCSPYTYSSALSQPTRDNVNGNNTACDNGPDFRDVWFTFTVTAATPPTWVDVYQQGIDVVTALYSGTPAGTCGPGGNITGLTYIDCSDNGLGGALDVATCTTPLHSRIDISSLPNGTYYYRVWEWNGGAPSNATYNLCVEHAGGDGVTSDECPGGPTIALTTCPNVSVSETYTNLSNAGMMGNACNTNTNEPQLATGAAGNYQDNCTGTLWTGIGYINNVMNNSAIYGFEINATPGCEPNVELTFDNMQYGGTPGNVAQIQVVNAPCAGGSGAVMLGTTSDPCFYMQPTTGTLPSGQYFIVVDGQDGQLIQYDLTIDITYSAACESNVPTADFNASSPVCTGSNSTITYTGNGNAGHNYTWGFDGGTINSGSGSGPYQVSWGAPGTYEVTLETSDGTCSNHDTVQVVVSDGPTITVTPTDASCNGANDGSAVANAAGGTAPYTYSWNTTPVQTTATATGLAAGNYTVTITDNNGCQSTANTTINEPTAIAITTSTVDANCGQPDGSATANPSGGTAPYTYSWNSTPVQTTATASGLAAGNYTVTVTDNNGCTQTASVTINDLPGVVASIASTNDASCNGANDGSAVANAAGGAAPYAYSWNTTPVQTTATATGLAAGNYTVTITDNNGCQSTANTTINEPTAIAITTSTVDANCGQPDGSATANPSGGTAPYTYSWNSTPVQTTATASGLAAGNYTVTVTDNNGCTQTANVTINDLPGVVASIASTNDASCNGANDGSAVANAAGGTAPYTYSWNTTPVQTTATATGLAAGNYTVTITDNNGCQSTANTTINEPTAITIATSTVDANCGQPDGSATANPSGGTAPYTYSWNSTPVQTTATASGLAAGNYTVTVTDNNGCTQTASVTINDLPGVVASIASTNDASCNGANDGSAVANAAGGAAPYAYSWNTTPVQTTATATGLAAGNYTVTITDNNGCQSTANTTINEPTAITITTSTVDANCGQPDGSATANPSGGAAPYTYSWNTTPVQNTATATNLAAGTYNVTVTDNNGCTQTASVNINNLGAPTVNITNTTDVTCNTGNDGDATANAAGGTAPYSYSWNTTPVQTTATASGLSAGTYTVTVTDNNGCQASANATINEPNAITATITTNDASCNGASDGDATVAVNGGTTPYTYSWNTTPVQTTATATGLAAGNYTVTITDNNGCQSTANTTINEPTAITITTSTVDANCGQPDGSATANPSGGTAPYTYSWNSTPVQTTATASALAAGNYTVTVTDNNGCTQTANVTINDLPGVVASIASTTDASCNGANDGSAVANAAGGTAPYTYSWNSTPVQTTATATGLAAGNYTVTITDNNGCQSTANTTINEPTAITITTSTVDANCGQPDGSATANPSGGTAPYTYSWNTAPVQTMATASALAAGNYTVTVTDNNGCTQTTNVTINDLPGVVASIASTTDASCNGANDGSAVANAAGGTAPYTYSWNTTPVQTTATATGLAAGNYTVTITDNNGCQSTANTTINEPTAIAITTSTVDANCGQPDGSATANPSGGTAPYTYSWNSTPVQTTATASGLAAGNYTVTVTDNNGCTQTANVTINDLPGVVASIASTTDASCNGANDGSALANAAGGTAPYTYSWNSTPVQTTATATGLAAGNYTVTITDNNGCQSTANTTINEPTAIAITTSTVDANCGQPDGSATANPSGGTAPYTYSWNTAPVQTMATASGLAAGNYTVTVTDNNGCTQTANVAINDLPGVVASIASTTDASCNGANDGSAVANAAGGTAPYTYSWNTTPVQTTATATGLAAGNYTATITDNNGCQSTANTTINEPTAIAITTSTVDANCGQPDGSATANPSGGTAPYTYSWNTTPVQNTATATNLAAGTYNVTVTDNNGCTQTASVNINNLGAPTVNITNTTDVTCNTGNDGDATANAAGGTAPYSYSWNTTPVQTTATASGLSAGTYTVTVTDNNGCQASANATINEPNAITATITTNDASCNGASDGDATVAVNGGTTPYTYSWNTTPVQTTATATGLAAGNYTVTITDNNGCQSTANTTINEPTAINLAISTMNANCGNDDGSATVTASGGNGSYSYSWNTNPAQTAATATQLFAGNYTVTVTDANGCQEMANAIVGNTSGFTVSISNVSHVTCNGANNGSATANTNGGVAPFNYQWNSNPNQFSQTITNVGSGLYIVTVTDANGCTAIDSVNINEPSAINNSTPTTVDICYGQSALLNSTPVGGTPNYNFEWSTGSNNQNINVSPLTNSTYWVIVSDANNCTADTNFINVNVSDPLQTAIIDDSLSICEGNSITINSNTTGGQPANYTYTWNPGNSNNESLTTNPNVSGWYVIEVSDGCSVPNGSDSIYIEVEQAPNAVFNLENLQGCSPVCVDLAGTDGSNYVYDWELGDGTFITGESFQYCYETPGTYDITLTVSNGGNCSATSTIISAVTVYDNPIADFITDDNEISITDGSINFDNYSSGFENFIWNFGDNQMDSTSSSPTHIYENAGEYWVSLLVSNEYGCTDSIQRLIKVTEDANIFVPNAFTPNNDGHNDLFGPVAIGLSESDYRFTIYDRWGQIVFETTQPNHFWDGRGKDSNYVKSDVYVWQLKARPDGTTDTQILTGHVTLTH